MSSPWLRLKKVTVLAATARSRPYPDKSLYELYPGDPSMLGGVPTPHLSSIIPFFHTVIVHNVPTGVLQAERIKTLENNFPPRLEIDYFWCPDGTIPGQKDSSQELIFVVCYDAKTAAALLEHIPHIKYYTVPLKGEIFVPEGKHRWKGARIRDIQEWGDVILWAGFVGEEVVLGMGARGSSSEEDQDLRWLANHHVSYVPEFLGKKEEVTMWLSSVEKDWKPIRKYGGSAAVRNVGQAIINSLKTRMYWNKNSVGLRLEFEEAKHAKQFRNWLAEKAVYPIPKRSRLLEKSRWYIYQYV